MRMDRGNLDTLDCDCEGGEGRPAGPLCGAGGRSEGEKGEGDENVADADVVRRGRGRGEEEDEREADDASAVRRPAAPDAPMANAEGEAERDLERERKREEERRALPIGPAREVVDASARPVLERGRSPPRSPGCPPAEKRWKGAARRRGPFRFVP